MMTDLLLASLRIALLVYAGLCAYVFVRQSSYVYYPTREVACTPAVYHLDYERVVLPTRDKEALVAWYVPAADHGAKTLLFCHGNAGNIGDRVDAVKSFHDLGFNVFVFDYRGFGESTGRPTERGTYLDALAAWEYLTAERGERPENIIVLGRSLGGAVAAWLAERVRPGALILEGAFTSAPDMAARMFPYLPARWLCRYRYNTLARLPKIQCPILVIHSRFDEIVPYEHGRRLFAAAGEPKRFLELQGDHNATESELTLEYQQALRCFSALAQTHAGEEDLRRGNRL
mgnify:CR=1 FL=1